jgi:hypothetical protein
MNVSGTLHLYSGKKKREMFFTFDDDVAQKLYRMANFDDDNLNSRRVYISVGGERFIHRRTLSFSRKQSELKVSLCSRSAKDGLGSLTKLYEWFAPPQRLRPKPFEILGTFGKRFHNGKQVWELRLTEPVGVVDPPGLERRKKKDSRTRRSFEHRRKIIRRDLTDIGRPAEALAARVAQRAFKLPKYSCLWRGEFLDSVRIEIRKLGIVADIDVWNQHFDTPELFIEVKAQKVTRSRTSPAFFLSLGEWRSYEKAIAKGLRYEIWLFQYREIKDFASAHKTIKLLIFDRLETAWRNPNGYFVTPPAKAASVKRLK